MTVPEAVARHWAKKPQEGFLLFARSALKTSMRFPDALKLLRGGGIEMKASAFESHAGKPAA